jgi:hypothetical protein
MNRYRCFGRHYSVVRSRHTPIQSLLLKFLNLLQHILSEIEINIILYSARIHTNVSIKESSVEIIDKNSVDFSLNIIFMY